MNDSVEHLRLRWTPELTAAAIQLLRGEPSGVEIPTMEQNGNTCLDLRGIRIEQTQLDGLIVRNANLRWSIIRDVGFKRTQLVDCNLSQATFFECYFRGAVFQNCDIVNAKFERSDFSQAYIVASRIDFASFKECEITLQTIRFPDKSDPRVLARSCRNLKLNAMSMGHFADAGEFTYLEKTHERHVLYNHAFVRQREPLGKRVKACREWAVSVFLNWLWGYGEKPGRLLLAMAAGIFLFGIVQYWLDGIRGASFASHLYFSGITFFTIGYGDLVPVEPVPRFLAVLEGALGITVIGMLIASCTKKIMYR
ncbi:MAG: ion channel [Acidobacteriota bacterium]